MPYRSGDAALLLLSLCLLALAATLGHARIMQQRHASAPARELVQSLRLTDLALMTEARYTRHPALADRHAPFQDHPLALEHFPSGALLAPPPHLVR